MKKFGPLTDNKIFVIRRMLANNLEPVLVQLARRTNVVNAAATIEQQDTESRTPLPTSSNFAVTLMDAMRNATRRATNYGIFMEVTQMMIIHTVRVELGRGGLSTDMFRGMAIHECDVARDLPPKSDWRAIVRPTKGHDPTTVADFVAQGKNMAV